MSYITSDKIEIYPTANRGPANSANLYNPGSHLLTEHNITGLERHIIERSFVITDSFIPGEDFEFSIKGYYFKLLDFKVSDVIGGNPSNVYASIKVLPQNPNAVADPYSDPNYVLTAYDESTSVDSLDKVEENNCTCLAVAFTTEAPTQTNTAGYTIYSLHLLEKENGTWKIPAASHLKLDAHDIKGGEEEEELGLDIYLHTNKISTNILTSDEGSTGVLTSLNMEPGKSITVSTIIGNNSKASSDLDIEGNVELEGKLETSSDLKVGHNLYIDNSVNVVKDLIVGDKAGVAGTLDVTGKTTFKDTVTVDKYLLVKDLGTFKGGVEANSTSTFDSVKASTINSTQALKVGKVLNIDSNNITFSEQPQLLKGFKLNSSTRMDVDLSGVTYRSSKDLNINTTIKIQGDVTSSGRTESDTNSSRYAYVREVEQANPKSIPNIDYINKNTASKLTATSDNFLTLSTAAGTVLSQLNLLKQVVNMVYPVGSIFMCDHWVNMNELFPGTSWETIRSGYALWSAGTADSYHKYAANTYYQPALPSLPNDSGTFTTWGDADGGSYSGSFVTKNSYNLMLDRNTVGYNLGGAQLVSFNSTTYKKPYGYEQASEVSSFNDNLVRPNCYAVYMWRRLA